MTTFAFGAFKEEFEDAGIIVNRAAPISLHFEAFSRTYSLIFALESPIPSAPLIAAAILPIPDVDLVFIPDDPLELEYMLLPTLSPVLDVTVDRAMLNILLPPPSRFKADENALLIVPTLLSDTSALDRAAAGGNR